MALNFNTIWQVLRQTDLNAIREQAERPFQLLIAAEREADAAALATLLGPDGAAARHPWLLVAEAPRPDTLRAMGTLDMAVLVTQSADLGPTLATTREALREQAVPVVTVVVGPPTRAAALARRGEAGRAVVAALDAVALPAIARAILDAAAPELRLALGRQLPPLRPPLFTELIDETARANASYSLSTGIAEIIPVLNIPLNVSDTLMLTKNQLVMSYKIALVAGKDGEPRELIGEILGVLGGGMLLRQIARQLVGLIPVAGIAPKVAVAYAGTWTIGRAIVLWATEGQEVSPETMRRFYDEALARGREVAAALIARARAGGSPWQRLRARLPFGGGKQPAALPAPAGEAPAPTPGWRARLRRFWPFGRKPESA